MVANFLMGYFPAARAKLCVDYTAAYPDEAPVVSLEQVENLSEAALAELHQLLEQQIQENLGMQMVFVLHSAVKEAMEQRNISAKEAGEQAELRRKQEETDREVVSEDHQYRLLLISMTHQRRRPRFFPHPGVGVYRSGQQQAL